MYLVFTYLLGSSLLTLVVYTLKNLAFTGNFFHFKRNCLTFSWRLHQLIFPAINAHESKLLYIMITIVEHYSDM